MSERLTIAAAAAPVFSRSAHFMNASGRLSAEEWAAVQDDLVTWARAEGGSGNHQPPVEMEGGPLPERLLRKLGRRDPFKDIPECPQCGRRVIVPNPSEEAA